MEDGTGRNGWHMWQLFGRYYARRLMSSPPVVVSGATAEERDAKIAAYLKDGRKALGEP